MNSLVLTLDKTKFEETADQVKEIFDLTSDKTFDQLEDKETFFQAWCGNYMRYYPEWFFVALQDKKILGYLACCPSSRHCSFEIPGPDYSGYFCQYPAHLHINCHPHVQARGVGSQLIKAMEEKLEDFSIRGVHLITSSGARNISFYQKNSFVKESTPLNEKTLLLGKSLAT